MPLGVERPFTMQSNLNCTRVSTAVSLQLGSILPSRSSSSPSLPRLMTAGTMILKELQAIASKYKAQLLQIKYRDETIADPILTQMVCDYLTRQTARRYCLKGEQFGTGNLSSRFSRHEEFAVPPNVGGPGGAVNFHRRTPNSPSRGRPKESPEGRARTSMGQAPVPSSHSGDLQSLNTRAVGTSSGGHRPLLRVTQMPATVNEACSSSRKSSSSCSPEPTATKILSDGL